MKVKSKTSKSFKEGIKNYIIENYKDYLLVFSIFLIGIFIGVFIMNNYDENKANIISNYIEQFINNLKNTNNIDKAELITISIKENIFLAIGIWIAGTTVIGMPVVLVIIGIRGVSLGYTISACTYSLGFWKGILFNIISLLLKNILFIPAILTLGISSIKLYKSIIKDRRRENIKIEILRHTILSLLMLGVLVLSSVVECIISIPLLKGLIRYF